MDKAPLDLTYAIIVKDKKRGLDIAVWEQYFPSNGDNRNWRLVLTPEFVEWSDLTLREKFKYKHVGVHISEIEDSKALQLELDSLRRFKEQSYEVKRLQLIFQNDMDMLMFKMRWI